MTKVDKTVMQNKSLVSQNNANDVLDGLVVLLQCAPVEHDRAMLEHLVWNFCPKMVTHL